MNEPIQIPGLSDLEAPEIVRPVFRRFRRRLLLSGMLFVIVAVLASYLAAQVNKPPTVLESIERSYGKGRTFHLIAKGTVARESWHFYAFKSFGQTQIVGAGFIGGGGTSFSGKGIDAVGSAVEFRLDHGSVSPVGSYTAIYGIAPKKAALVRILPNSGEAIEIGTVEIRGFPYRFFGALVTEDIEVAQAEAYDSYGEVIPPKPLPDVRTLQQFSPDSLRAAEAAFSAAGDRAAVVANILGPFAFSDAQLITGDRPVFTVEASRQVFIVDPWGQFTSAGRPEFGRLEQRSRHSNYLVSTEGQVLMGGQSDSMVRSP